MTDLVNDHELTPLDVSTIRTGELCPVCDLELCFPVLMGEQGLGLGEPICTGGEPH